MAETRLIQKQLACKEDLLLGIGKATQKRASGDREITKLNVTELQGALVVETIEDLENLDPTKLSEKTVTVKDIDRGGTFVYISENMDINNGGTIFNGWTRQYSGAVNVKWFGAKCDGINDDSSILHYLVTNNYEVEIPDGVLLANSTIGNLSQINIVGSKNTTIKTTVDINLFSIAGKCNIKNINISQDGTAGTGIAFTTSLTGNQLAHSIFKNITVSNFKIGLYCRYSLWNIFESIQFQNCKAGMIFSGNDVQSTYYEVRPNWNSWTNGFFHNQNILNNVLCNGGELGIFYCGTGISMNNITTQGQNTKGTLNVILPSGQYGTGLWVNGSSSYLSEATINTLYSEGSENPIRTYKGIIKIDGFFVQGGTIASKYKAVIINDSGNIELNNSWGQDYFENLIEFNNTSSTPTVTGNVPSLTVPSQKYTGTGYYNVGKTYKKYKHLINHSAGTPSGTTYTLSDVVPTTNEVYKVSIVGIQDGTFHRIGEYILYSGQTTSLKSIVTVQAGANFTVTQNGFTPMITVNTTTSMLLTVYTEKVGSENLSPSTIIVV